MIRLVLAFGGNSANEDDPTEVIYCGHQMSEAQKKIDAYAGEDDLRIVEIPQLRRAKKTRVETQPPEEKAVAPADREQRRNEDVRTSAGEDFDAKNPIDQK